jgi:NADPH-dependent ferric siderophore reductase
MTDHRNPTSNSSTNSHNVNSVAAERTPERVRHELKRRLLQVARVDMITPHLKRITLTGEDLHDFVSAGFDDHVKVFFPEPGADRPVLSEGGPGTPPAPGEPRPTMRDYTPRRFDTAARELAIDFVIHEAGPATEWASQAQPGQYLAVGGPRGSFVIPDGFDWYWLIGDESALPAIARRLEELPAGVQVVATIEGRDAQARFAFDTRANVQEQWCYASEQGESALLDAVRATRLPEGQGYVWAAGESAVMRAVRQHLAEERAIHKSRIRASSYWKRGATGVHETLDD